MTLLDDGHGSAPAAAEVPDQPEDKTLAKA